MTNLRIPSITREIKSDKNRSISLRKLQESLSQRLISKGIWTCEFGFKHVRNRNKRRYTALRFIKIIPE